MLVGSFNVATGLHTFPGELHACRTFQRNFFESGNLLVKDRGEKICQLM